MNKKLTLAAVALLTLTACGSSDESSTDTPTSEQSSAQGQSTVHTGVANWEGADELGASYVVTTGATAPSGVDEARELMGASGKQLSYVAVTVDNRQGSAPASVGQVSFTDPDGSLVQYSTLSNFLDYQEAAEELSVDASNRVNEVHNAFTADEYQVAVGQKKTVILASESKVPEQVTNATVNGMTALAPTDKTAETDKATGAPEPTEPVGSNEALADLRGTTLKGNDIRFGIYNPNYQKELNAEMPEALNGAWGALCSVAATEEQLNETGALTEGGHVWRSMNYALPEASVPGLGSEADYKAYEAEARVEGGDEKCVLVHSVDPAAATKTTTATVGQYVGTAELLNAVEVQ